MSALQEERSGMYPLFLLWSWFTLHPMYSAGVSWVLWYP